MKADLAPKGGCGGGKWEERMGHQRMGGWGSPFYPQFLKHWESCTYPGLAAALGWGAARAQLASGSARRPPRTRADMRLRMVCAQPGTRPALTRAYVGAGDVR